jgi:hypothetical protein
VTHPLLKKGFNNVYSNDNDNWNRFIYFILFYFQISDVESLVSTSQ